MSEEWKQFLTLVIVPIVILILSYINEKGFENLVSQMIVEKFLKPLKPYQPILVTGFGIILSYVAKLLGANVVPDLTPYMNAGGDVGTVFAGILIAVLSMAIHAKLNPRADG